MVNFRICRQCGAGEYQPESRDSQGNLDVRPAVHCTMADGVVLLMNSTVPEGCPYLLEHILSCQEVDPSLANYVSGGPPFKEASDD